MSLAQTREILERLISFDTVSTKSNTALIEYVRGYLVGCGVRQLRVLPSEDGVHACLLATLPAADGGVEGGLVLSGHTDVVPVDGQKWDSDPFVLTDKGDGRLYGRGTCDMKGFIAVVLALTPVWLKEPLSKPLHIALTYNEETDLEGFYLLAKKAGDYIKKCEGCIIGEPTMLDMVIAHKGMSESFIHLKGTAAHSSMQYEGYNAFESATRLLQRLFALRDSFAAEGPFERDFGTPHTTVCPSLIKGGVALNTIPDECVIGFEFRNVPCHSLDGILATIQSHVDEENKAMQRDNMSNSARLETVTKLISFRGPDDSSVLRALQAAVPGNRKPITASFYTEAGEYQHLGVNTVVCGPGSIAQAHKANEFIAVDQLAKGISVMDATVRLMCAAAPSSRL